MRNWWLCSKAKPRPNTLLGLPSTRSGGPFKLVVVNSGGLLVFRMRLIQRILVAGQKAGAWRGCFYRFLIPFAEPVIDPFSSFFHHLFFGAFFCSKTNIGSRKPNVAKGSGIFIELYVRSCFPESCRWILVSFHKN